MDFGLTTRELGKMFRQAGLDVPTMPKSDFDDPFGAATGSGLIFGATGGVMESALRTVIELVTGLRWRASIEHGDIIPVRGFEGVRYAEITITEVGPVPDILEHLVPDWDWLKGATLKVAVAHGTANARKVMEDIKAGGKFSECHFIEFMACPGGCLGGGGQPIPTSKEIRAARAKAIYAEEKTLSVRKSYENPAVLQGLRRVPHRRALRPQEPRAPAHPLHGARQAHRVARRAARRATRRPAESRRRTARRASLIETNEGRGPLAPGLLALPGIAPADAMGAHRPLGHMTFIQESLALRPSSKQDAYQMAESPDSSKIPMQCGAGIGHTASHSRNWRTSSQSVQNLARSLKMKRLSLKNMTKARKIGLLAGVFLAATAMLGGTALAASSVHIIAGSLTITTPTVGNFADVTLDGTAHTTQATVGTYDVIDATGSGSGWKVQAQASQFSTGGATPILLATGSLKLEASTVAANNATSGAVPTIVSGPYTIDSGSAVKIASAAVGAGMGSYKFTPPANALTLSIPSSAYAGTYNSTVTVSVVTGP